MTGLDTDTDTDTVTAQGLNSWTTRAEGGDFYLATSGDLTWPPVGTLPRPWTLVTSGARTALDLARWAPHDARRLAMLDLSARFGLIQRAGFAHFLDPLGGLHRLRQVRDLVPLVSARAESVPESEMRYGWTQAGLPAPVVNQPIYDRFNNFVARVDLFEPESGLAGEYQGILHHLDQAPELDATRRQRLGQMNITVAEVWKEGRSRTEGILLKAQGQARVRDSRLDAWTCPQVDDW